MFRPVCGGCAWELYRAAMRLGPWYPLKQECRGKKERELITNFGENMVFSQQLEYGKERLKW
jgi:hypothetical protein